MSKLRERVERFIADLHHEVEQNGKVVKLITLEEVADLHEVEQQTAWKHFNKLIHARIDRELFFKVGRDYFVASRKTGRVYKARSTSAARRARKSLVLLTERGYLKLIQRFSDVRAAYIQDVLVESYFRLKEMARAGQLLMEENRLLRQQVTLLTKQVQVLMDDRAEQREMLFGLMDMNKGMVSLAGQMLAHRKQQIRQEDSLSLALEDMPLFRSAGPWRN